MSRPAFTCSHGCVYTNEELELGMRWVDMDADMERQRLAYELESDLAHEAELARLHALGEAECPWPWYADRPTIVVRPRIVGGR